MDTLMGLIEQVGYFAFFFVLCLGVIGLPLPNEVVVMIGGVLAGTGHLAPVSSFITIYLGICSGLTVGFVVSRLAASRLLDRLTRSKRMARYIDKAELLNRKYGNMAMCISVFLPVLRNVTPYAVGMKGMAYRRFALVSYTTAFVWTLLYFLIGSTLGLQVDDISTMFA
ncbi:DedA family protein [Paenibacillus cellulositrophicus]|jgi:membrane protein DedA with SNARE-associated domain|uniref:DedA family protein n=2 Tax=Paenibacillus TaxID=44249 RepID=A0A1R1EK95_9BACL|nr:MULTISPECIES: DedA family protein [Paenibacillus]MBJ9992011.1 DedA family protein [Paenibacillus sp. S28]MCM3000103.1 DedA family protein [Paenibacillus cellulositrophicus]MEC0177553.1 DedA family protein [Paenibacillus favisporus]OMF52245.1 DedA family protein [Paenibacillus rhizosphaerae]OXL86424.1 hypothetical protein BCV73_27600 [Paenibacillus sp. SSG-1]